MVRILAAHRVPYAATASVGFPEDLMKKVQKAKEIRGTRFIHIFAFCPTGWRHETQLGMAVARKAVACRVFPLYEVFNGEDWQIGLMPPKTPVDDYLDMQGRFKGMDRENRRRFQAWVDEAWGRLLKRSCPEVPSA
jgi:pyruvate/2-oxoacid:ferredoxin oxidoreductase beta subunit